jgi:dethiobiotin synthetase
MGRSHIHCQIQQFWQIPTKLFAKKSVSSGLHPWLNICPAIMSEVIFITGTDTDVGKTMVTALLLAHLRGEGINALAIKPFCSGGRKDVELLQTLQGHILADEQVNPWFFPAPVAPLVALRRRRKNINKHAVIAHIQKLQEKGDILLVEGAGGLRSPLAKNLDALEIIAALKCRVMLAARNRLGCLNHVLLSLDALRRRGISKIKVILMGVKQPDLASRTNAQILREMPGFIEVYAVPWLGRNAARPGAVKKNAKKIKKTLARIADFGTNRGALLKTAKAAGKNI